MKCWHKWHKWNKWETVEKGKGAESPQNSYYKWHYEKNDGTGLVVAYFEVQRRECRKCGQCELHEESAGV